MIHDGDEDDDDDTFVAAQLQGLVVQSTD